jgi:hypothetical protein
MAEFRAITFKGVAFADKQGTRRLIEGTSAPVLDEAGTLLGAVLVFHGVADAASRLRGSDRVEEIERDMESTLKRAGGIINLCAWCKRVPDSFGGWCDIGAFITDRSGIQLNGGLCPDCMARCFPSATGADIASP